MEFRKAHSAPKRVVPQGKELDSVVSQTMAIIAKVVGSTLGPGGRHVLIEQQGDLPPKLSKDGVTVFRSLGFQDTLAQAVAEAIREGAIRTANLAGDGTTTATILAQAIFEYTGEFCKANPRYSPQRLVREMASYMEGTIVPVLENAARRVTLEDEEGRQVLRRVATISANGDADLADAVMRCYDICGDEGNVTILESIGAPRYEVEQIQGYPMPGVGWEESTRYLFAEFLSEPEGQRTNLARPVFFLYHGAVDDFALIERMIGVLMGQPGVLRSGADTFNLVIMATRFSERALASMAVNFQAQGTPKVFPLVVPLSQAYGGQRSFLDDVAAVTGAVVYDPLTNPVDNVTFAGLGTTPRTEDTPTGEALVHRSSIESIEICRNKSTIFGCADPDLILLRVDELRAGQEADITMLESTLLTERIARLAGGIARLTVWDTAPSACSEKKDRADDAVCAVRGALRKGVLFGGCHGLQQVRQIDDGSPAAKVLNLALRRPLERLLENVGLFDEEAQDIIDQVGRSGQVYDALNMRLVNADEAGIYDSAAAVIEALRSSLSIASLMGTLGGAVVSPRDAAYERAEASDQAYLASQLEK